MDSKIIFEIIKEEMKIICKNCEERKKAEKKDPPSVDECFVCPIHLLANRIIEALK